MKVRVTRTRPGAVIPTYGTPDAAAFDISAAETTEIAPRSMGRIFTGLVFQVPKDHVLLIFARSSTFPKLGLILSNGVGVIDPDYNGPQDEVLILMYNPGDATVTVQIGMRIAQGMIIPRPGIEFEEGPTDSPSRGGIGSTRGYGERSS